MNIIYQVFNCRNKGCGLWGILVSHFLVTIDEIIVITTVSYFKESAKNLSVFKRE